MAAWRYKISLLVLKKYFTRLLVSLVKYFSTLEEKFRISAWPCNILYIFIHMKLVIYLFSSVRTAGFCKKRTIMMFMYHIQFSLILKCNSGPGCLKDGLN